MREQRYHHRGLLLWLIHFENLLRLVAFVLAFSDAWTSWREWDFLVFAIAQAFLAVNCDPIIQSQFDPHKHAVIIFPGQLAVLKSVVTCALAVDIGYLVRLASESDPPATKVYVPLLVFTSSVTATALMRLRACYNFV